MIEEVLALDALLLKAEAAANMMDGFPINLALDKQEKSCN